MYCKKTKRSFNSDHQKNQKTNKTLQIKYIVEIPVALEEDRIPGPRWSL